MQISQVEQVRQLAERFGVIGRGDLRDAGLPEDYLHRMADRGELVELAPGIYMFAAYEPTALLELLVVAKRIPQAVFFGPTALQFHAIGTQAPQAVHVALERGTWDPTLEWPRIETFHISTRPFQAGIEIHEVEGHEIRMYSAAKAIVDMFKFRNRFGLEAATEALRDAWQSRKVSSADLEKYAKTCRVQTVMRPYMEMLR